MTNGDVFIYNLGAPLDYSKGGEFEKTSSLEFRAPGMPEFDEGSDLSQMVMNAFIDAGKHNQQQTDVKTPEDLSDVTPDADEIKVTLMASQAVKFKDIAKVFRKLAIKVGTCDGTIKMKQSHFDKVSMDDFNGMLCGYIAHFTFPSLFKAGDSSKAEATG
jgi:hypothetical protein